MCISKVVIASLLHDIGKLIQRAENKQVYHGKIGADYLTNIGFDNDILEAVYCHHGNVLKSKQEFSNELLTYLVYEADNIASGLDRRENVNTEDEQEQWQSNTALKTIFSYLNTDKIFDKKNEYFYPARDLNPNKNIMYPTTGIYASSDKYAKLKEILDENLEKDITPNSLLELLETTTTYITSSTNAKENLDISLFDHSKMTAAIASCLYKYIIENKITDYKKVLFTTPDRNKNYYKLVSGDISGIQDFIYTISSKGALKSLRARSFYLELILEHVVDEILEALSLYRCNLLYTGGGHFYMLLPNTEETDRILNLVQEKINNWFVSEFADSLYIAIASVEASAIDLKCTKGIFKSVSRLLSKKKQSRYNKKQLEKLIFPQKNISERECTICKTSSKETNSRKFISSDIETCEVCYQLFKLGEKLVQDDIKLIVSNTKTEDSLNLPTLADKPKFLNVTNEKVTEDAIRVYVLNDRQMGEKYTTKLFVGNYCYKINNKIANFEDLIREDSGINRLGVLRCDVDNLGQTFVNGLSDTYSTLSRVTSLSRQLSLFFKFYINNICKSNISGEADIKPENFSLSGKSECNKKMSIVYSGGDDVFVVGDWLDIINFAIDLRKAFKLYTCSKLSFSAGIGFFTVGYPIAQMAFQTGELEDIAKKYDNDSKDAISLFGVSQDRNDTYHWDEFNTEVYGKIQLLSSVCNFDESLSEHNKIFFSTSMMYKFKQLLTPKDENKFNLSRLAYTLARVKPSDRDLDKNGTLKEHWTTFRTSIYKWCQDDKKALLTALDLIIYMNRKEVKYE